MPENRNTPKRPPRPGVKSGNRRVYKIFNGDNISPEEMTKFINTLNNIDSGIGAGSLGNGLVGFNAGFDAQVKTQFEKSFGENYPKAKIQARPPLSPKPTINSSYVEVEIKINGKPGNKLTRKEKKQRHEIAYLMSEELNEITEGAAKAELKPGGIVVFEAGYENKAEEALDKFRKIAKGDSVLQQVELEQTYAKLADEKKITPETSKVEQRIEPKESIVVNEGSQQSPENKRVKPPLPPKPAHLLIDTEGEKYANKRYFEVVGLELKDEQRQNLVEEINELSSNTAEAQISKGGGLIPKGEIIVNVGYEKSVKDAFNQTILKDSVMNKAINPDKVFIKPSHFDQINQKRQTNSTSKDSKMRDIKEGLKGQNNKTAKKFVEDLVSKAERFTKGMGSATKDLFNGNNKGGRGK